MTPLEMDLKYETRGKVGFLALIVLIQFGFIIFIFDKINCRLEQIEARTCQQEHSKQVK